MAVQLQVIGCGDAFASGGKANTCFLVKSQKNIFLIDCGASALVELKRLGYSTQNIDFIIISHFHGDHYGGLPFFLLDAFFNEKRQKELQIISPKGGKDRIMESVKAFYTSASQKIESMNIRFVEYESGPVMIDDIKISALPVIHAEPSRPHALKIEVEDKLISYSGDTEWTENLVEISRDADLFICECNNYDQSVPGHIDYLTLIEKSKSFDCKNIALTHLGESMIQNQNKLEMTVLSDGEVIDI